MILIWFTLNIYIEFFHSGEINKYTWKALNATNNFDELAIEDNYNFKVFYYGDNTVYYTSNIYNSNLDQVKNILTSDFAKKSFHIEKIERYEKSYRIIFANASKKNVVYLNQSNDIIEIHISSDRHYN